MPTVQFEYRFALPGQASPRFLLEFDAATMTPLTAPGEPAPFWAELDFHRCPHFPLLAEETPDCPAAARLAGAAGMVLGAALASVAAPDGGDAGANDGGYLDTR